MKNLGKTLLTATMAFGLLLAFNSCDVEKERKEQAKKTEAQHDQSGKPETKPAKPEEKQSEKM
jgi:hypothetical protein